MKRVACNGWPLKRRLRTALNGGILAAVLAAMFWEIWFLIFKNIPATAAVQWTPETALALPFAVSRLWDIPAAFGWGAALALTGTYLVSAWRLDADGPVAAGLAAGLAVGLTAGLMSGLAAGVTFGLAAGVTFGLTTGMAFGLAAGLMGSLFGGLAGSLAVGVTLGLAFGVTLGLAVGLAFGLVGGLAAGLASGLMPLLPIGLVAAVGIAALSECVLRRIAKAKNG